MDRGKAINDVYRRDKCDRPFIIKNSDCEVVLTLLLRQGLSLYC